MSQNVPLTTGECSCATVILDTEENIDGLVQEMT